MEITSFSKDYSWGVEVTGMLAAPQRVPTEPLGINSVADMCRDEGNYIRHSVFMRPVLTFHLSVLLFSSAHFRALLSTPAG